MFLPIPDAELRPGDFNLKIGRYLYRRVPKVPGVHRFIETRNYTDVRGGARHGLALMAVIRWCWDCGLSDERAGETCTGDGAGRDGHGEFAAAHNRRHCLHPRGQRVFHADGGRYCGRCGATLPSEQATPQPEAVV